MSLARRDFNPKPVASLVLCTGPGYSLDNLQKLAAENKQDPNIKKYLDCLITFKNELPAEESKEVKDFLNQLAQLENFLTPLTKLEVNDNLVNDSEFLAAVYNLQGLIHIWLKNYEAALGLFAQAVPYVKTNPVSCAVLYSHMGYVFHEQENVYNSPLRSHQWAAEEIAKISRDTVDPETRQTAAAIYSELAFAYHEANPLNYAKLAELNYDIALTWWPESMTIADDRASLLAKINPDAASIQTLTTVNVLFRHKPKPSAPSVEPVASSSSSMGRRPSSQNT